MKKLSAITLIASLALLLSSCWNYREINQINIVAGIGIDKGKLENTYDLTIELVNIEGGKDSKQSSRVITVTGESMFDSARNAIAIAGRRLYWSHAKVIIISQEIAKEGVAKIIDWYGRDSETRPDVNILVAKTKTAQEIFSTAEETDELVSFQLSETIQNEKSLSRAPKVELWELISHFYSSGDMAIAPAVGLLESNTSLVPHIEGTAVFYKDQLIGFLDASDTKYLLFVKNDIKGGVLVEDIEDKGKTAQVSLEIFNNRTKVTPQIKDGKLIMKLNVKTLVAIDEVMGNDGFDVIKDKDARKQLEELAEKSLKEHMEYVIKKVQGQYQSDILSFGDELYKKMPAYWKSIEQEWDVIFPGVEVEVACDMTIKNSAMMAKVVKEVK